MKETKDRSHFTPEGWHTVTTRIVVHDAEKLIELLRQVSHFTLTHRVPSG